MERECLYRASSLYYLRFAVAMPDTIIPGVGGTDLFRVGVKHRKSCTVAQSNHS